MLGKYGDLIQGSHMGIKGATTVKWLRSGGHEFDFTLICL